MSHESQHVTGQIAKPVKPTKQTQHLAPEPVRAIGAARATAVLRPPLGIVGGIIAGASAAVFYTMANIALRQSVDVDPFLVSAVKAAPTVIFLTPFLAWMFARGQTLATSLRMIPRFALVALLGQFVGNAAFQWALGSIGLAASVPITLGVLLIGGAVLGRWILGEPVRPRAMIAIFILIIAVVLLSLPNASDIPSESVAAIPAWAGALCAAASGAAYALFGTVMRQSMTGGLSAPLTMWISGIVGVVSLWTVTLLRMGGTELAGVALDEWKFMSIAGVCNFTAFIALSIALKALPVVAVNLINASQVAMAAIAAVVIFGERLTLPLCAGIVLTFVGLAVLANRKKRFAK